MSVATGPRGLTVRDIRARLTGALADTVPAPARPARMQVKRTARGDWRITCPHRACEPLYRPTQAEAATAAVRHAEFHQMIDRRPH